MRQVDRDHISTQMPNPIDTVYPESKLLETPEDAVTSQALKGYTQSRRRRDMMTGSRRDQIQRKKIKDTNIQRSFEEIDRTLKVKSLEMGRE